MYELLLYFVCVHQVVVLFVGQQYNDMTKVFLTFNLELWCTRIKQFLGLTSFELKVR